MEQALAAELGLPPGDRVDPAYVRRALQLYYSNENELRAEAGLDAADDVDGATTTPWDVTGFRASMILLHYQLLHNKICGVNLSIKFVWVGD